VAPHPLDDMAWHALSGPQASLSVGIRERGDVPVLHGRDRNEGARRLYRRTGLELRRMVSVVVRRRGTA